MSVEVLQACAPYLCGILVAVLLLRILIGLSGAQAQWSAFRRLHRDEGGAVQGLSFVLTLPFFVMVLLFIVQLSQLTIARVTLEYAGFAAARAATVWIPARLGYGREMDGLNWEDENQIGLLRVYLGQMQDDQGVTYDRYGILPGGIKYEKIKMAAAMALMPVAPSRRISGGVQGDVKNNAAEAIVTSFESLAPGSLANTRIEPRLRNKLAYAAAATDVWIEVRHKESDLPLWVLLSDGRPFFKDNEIGWQDQVYVTVVHEFALLPGPGRFLNRVEPPPFPWGTDRVAERIEIRENTAVYSMATTVRIRNEGQAPVIRYNQTYPLPLNENKL